MTFDRIEVDVDRSCAPIQEVPNHPLELLPEVDLLPVVDDWARHLSSVERRGHLYLASEQGGVSGANLGLQLIGLEVLLLVRITG